MAAPNYETAIRCVKAALDRIHVTEAAFESVEQSPSVHPDVRLAARIAASAALQEFAWQWENVDLIIREKNL